MGEEKDKYTIVRSGPGLNKLIEGVSSVGEVETFLSKNHRPAIYPDTTVTFFFKEENEVRTFYRNLGEVWLAKVQVGLEVTWNQSTESFSVTDDETEFPNLDDL